MIGIILETSILALLGARRLSFPSLIETTTYNLGGVFVTNKKIMIVLVSLSLALALHQFIRRTKWGMAMRAMAFDYAAVPLMGVPLNTVVAVTFAIGSALAAAAGVLFGVAYPVLDPYMGIILGWKAFVAAILGGRGSVMGATLAGFLLGFTEKAVRPERQNKQDNRVRDQVAQRRGKNRCHEDFGEPQRVDRRRTRPG